MTPQERDETRNLISGGIQFGPVLQDRGRDGELAMLAGLLDPAGSAGPVVVSAMAGLAGVGTTTLAIHAV